MGSDESHFNRCRVLINPFTATTFKISGLKDARTRLQTVYFPVLYRIYFQLRYILMTSLLHASAKNKPKRLKGFKFRTFSWSFSLKRHRGSEGVNHCEGQSHE